MFCFTLAMRLSDVEESIISLRPKNIQQNIGLLEKYRM